MGCPNCGSEIFTKEGTDKGKQRYKCKLCNRKYVCDSPKSEVFSNEQKQLTKRYLEKDLHPLLTYYAKFYLNVYCKTINHSKSGKKEFGEWLHPDIVGCWFPIGSWSQSSIELSQALGVMNVRLYSFELKRELNFSNLREAFF